MSAQANRIKAALARGEMQIGVWLGLTSPAVAEIAGGAGFDWALIDAEHGPNDLARIEAQLRALAATGTPAAVRVPAGEAWMLKRVLDLGAQTVMVPMVETGDDAARLARAMRYPPEGTRGIAHALVRASGYGADRDYLRTANAEICLIVQAESRRAVENIDAIAGTPGVDAVFVGPADLAADLGHPGDPGAPEVRAAIARVAAGVQKAGKALGYLSFDPAEFVAARDRGVRFLAVAADVTALGGALRSRAAEARRLVGDGFGDG